MQDHPKTAQTQMTPETGSEKDKSGNKQEDKAQPFRPPGPQHLICSPGKNIIEQGAPSNKAFVIEDGRAEVLVDQGGETIKIAEIGPGEIFGEMGVLENRNRMATVRAIEKTKVLIISRAEIEDKLETIEDPAIKSLITVLMKRLRDANKNQVGHQQNITALRNRILGLASKARNGIDKRQKDAFTQEIMPLLEKMEQVLDKYQKE